MSGKSPELLNFETHGMLYEQVTAFHTTIVTTINLYILASGGVWAFALANGPKLTPTLILSVGAFHVLISLAATLICLGLAGTIRRRLDFLTELGEKHWQTVQGIGKGLPKRWEIRKAVKVWVFIPLVGAVAGSYLTYQLCNQDHARVTACEHYFERLEAASTPLDFNRAVFLFNNASCDSLRVR